MKDIRIYRKLRPLIMKRVGYAALGLFVMLALLWIVSILGYHYPENRKEIVISFACIGVFIGWKIIRKGESQYRLAQISMITDIVRGIPATEVRPKQAMQKARSTFRYSTFFGLIGYIFKYRDLKKLGQYLGVMISNLMPYVGSCTISWIFAHPEEDRRRSICRAFSNYHNNRRQLLPKLLFALLAELLLVIAIFIVVIYLLSGVYKVVINQISATGDVYESILYFTDTLDIVLDSFFAPGNDYHWMAGDIIFIVSLYIAWFVKVFSVRAYLTIGFLRTYLRGEELNPPTDALYERLATEREKVMLRRALLKERMAALKKQRAEKPAGRRKD